MEKYATISRNNGRTVKKSRFDLKTWSSSMITFTETVKLLINSSIDPLTAMTLVCLGGMLLVAFAIHVVHQITERRGRK
jgi:ketopantoate reductase